jgi:malate synthase
MRRPITAGATPSACAVAVRLPLVATATKDSKLLELVHLQPLLPIPAFCTNESLRREFSNRPGIEYNRYLGSEPRKRLPTMTARTTVHGLQVATVLKDFIDARVLPGTGIAPEAFWPGFAAIVRDLAPRNAHAAGRARPPAGRARRLAPPASRAHPRTWRRYRAFLQKIGYLRARAGCGEGPHRATSTRSSPHRPGRSWWCPSRTRATR